MSIFEQPYCRISNLVDKKIAKRQTASEYLKKLETIGVLKEEKAGKENLYVNIKLMDILSKNSNEFEDYKT